MVYGWLTYAKWLARLRPAEPVEALILYDFGVKGALCA